MADPSRVTMRRLAQHDVDQAVDWYREHADVRTALGFVDALEAAMARAVEHPSIGSPRYAVELDLPGLRHVPLVGFRHLVFHVVGGATIDVWRVLHASRDVPTWLATDDTDAGQ